MNIKEIDETIGELEQGATTFDNAFKLSALYIVRENLKPPLKQLGDSVETELSDILPQYKHYVEVRRSFQMGKTTESEMLDVLKLLCQEIKEFLQALYSSTSNPEEQQILHELYSNLR